MSILIAMILFVLGYTGVSYITFLGLIITGEFDPDCYSSERSSTVFFVCAFWPAMVPIILLVILISNLAKSLSSFHKRIYEFGRKIRGKHNA